MHSQVGQTITILIFYLKHFQVQIYLYIFWMFLLSFLCQPLKLEKLVFK